MIKADRKQKQLKIEKWSSDMKRKLSSLIAVICIGIGVFSCVCQASGMDIGKEDGEYSIQVDLEGGSGKASVT